MNCRHCNGICIKAGIQKINNQQRYCCKLCGKKQQQFYTYNAYQIGINTGIINHIKESCGIRSISRLLSISTTTLLKRIQTIALDIHKPLITIGKTYELDELKTYVKKKSNEQWLIYAIDRTTKVVVDFKIGKRNANNLKKVTETLLLSNANRIYTDGLTMYKFLIPAHLHCVKARQINHIERMNLTLRTHLKRLCRKTLCYSKSLIILECCIRIYLWG